jgi:hypothetical protein
MKKSNSLEQEVDKAIQEEDVMNLRETMKEVSSEPRWKIDPLFTPFGIILFIVSLIEGIKIFLPIKGKEILDFSVFTKRIVFENPRLEYLFFFCVFFILSIITLMFSIKKYK